MYQSDSWVTMTDISVIRICDFIGRIFKKKNYFNISLHFDWIPGIGSTLSFSEKKQMRRSKRKASAVATERLAEAVSATAADATCCNTDVNEDESDKEYSSDEGEMSDGENALHGPCNLRPCGLDEDARFVLLCFAFRV